MLHKKSSNTQTKLFKTLELNFLTIKYNGKEKDYPDKFLDELLYKLVVLKTYNLKPIQLFSYIFFIYEKLSLKSLGFEEPLNFLNNLIQKEFPEGLKSIRLQKIESDGIVMGLKIDKPSSGVILLINILILKYIHTQYSEIDLILMDEPDRHFEPELIEYFFNIINNSFKNTRVIITTHRPDSIALAPQGSLWTIRIENDGKRIISRRFKIN
ncbi:unnamed protein product [Brachionus calyciflorus]|uniref:Uncharacterized protein n=1 Tax=Brachionus calyciflorus TaxID=104777 RepID=A0A814GV59_9BILA|nr:unnamed protein product [Brachionus calyciflorus]